MALRFKMLFLSGLILLVMLGLILPKLTLSQAEAQVIPKPDYGQQWKVMTSIITNTLIPLQEQFVTQTEQFEAAAEAFRQQPTLDTLDALQEAWRQTSLAWARADQIGLERSTPIRTQINKPPANFEFIEGFITDYDTIDLDFITNIGSTAKGLSAIEYLIFDPNGNDEAVLGTFVDKPRAAQRMQYVVAAVKAVHRIGSEYLQQWLELKQHYQDEDAQFNADQIAYATIMDLRMMTNKWLSGLETVISSDLADPLGLTSGGDIRPELVEAPRAHYSTELLLAYLDGFKMVFNGTASDNSNMLGYDDGLDFVKAQFEDIPLSQAINQQIDAATDTLKTFDKPLEDQLTAQPQDVQAAHDALKTLVRLVKADMTSQLSIALIYADNDGD